MGLRGDSFHRAGIRAGVRLAQGKGGNLVAPGHRRQVSGLLRRAASQGDGATAQALHGKGKVSQRGVVGQGLAQHHQRARIELRQGPAKGRRHAVAQPSGVAQGTHPGAAGGAVVLLVDLLLRHPGRQSAAQAAVRRVKKRQRQVIGGGHLSRPRKAVFAWPQRPHRHAENPVFACK